ncbi:MAG: stage 0 sporulation family protein [Desulfobulbaceae bacterium]
MEENTTPNNTAKTDTDGGTETRPAEEENSYYRIRFRDDGREFTVQSRISNLGRGETVIASTDHGPEPARIVGRAASAVQPGQHRMVSYVVTRRATREEEEKYARLPAMEKEAFDICEREIRKLDLPMQLVRVEKFFNGSKIIFYFTAENRVDFRELVKNLVQEFRTRVEMRQIGVRHETQIIGGIGACGRELCCSSFLKKFESVSIKMAKAQDLPLNPSKISGLCNRLLCCLTYEYDTYLAGKKEMPRVGRSIRFEGDVYKVVRAMALQRSIVVISKEGEERVLSEEEWKRAEPVQKGSAPGKKKRQ